MRMRQKVCGKRYFLYARRNKNEKWTDWTQCNDLDRAYFHVENIKSAGFLSKLFDKKMGKELEADGAKALS